MKHTPQTHALIHLVRAYGTQSTLTRTASDDAVAAMDHDLQRRKAIRELKTAITEAEALVVRLKKSSIDKGRIQLLENRIQQLRGILHTVEQKKK